MPRNRRKAHDTHESHDSHGEADGRSARPSADRVLAEHRQMLEEAREEQDRIKKAQEIVFARGLSPEQREQRLVAELGYSETEATKIMTQKSDEDQFGNPVVRPGFTRAERGRVASNVRYLEQKVKRLEEQAGVRHQAAEERREQEPPSAGQQLG